MRILIALAVLNLLAACGTKTPLTLPPPAVPKAVAVSPARPEGNTLGVPTLITKDNNKAADIAQ